jgi:hypothetical protein
VVAANLSRSSGKNVIAALPARPAKVASLAGPCCQPSRDYMQAIVLYEIKKLAR